MPRYRNMASLYGSKKQSLAFLLKDAIFVHQKSVSVAKSVFLHLSCHPPIGLSPISIPSTCNSINFFARPSFYMAEPHISTFRVMAPYRNIRHLYTSDMGPPPGTGPQSSATNTSSKSLFNSIGC